MSTQLADLFVKIGAATREFDTEYSRVERQVKGAKLVFNPKVNPASLVSLNAEMQRLKARAQELRGRLLTIEPKVENAEQINALEDELQAVQHRMEQVGQSTDHLRERFKRLGEIGQQLTLKLSLPIMAGFALATRAGMQFEAQMRNVNSIAKQSESALQGTSNQVKELAKNVGKGPTDLASGLYDIASSGFSGAQGLQVLTAAAVGAKAGIATTAEAANALTTVLNAYGMGADQAARINDVMFKAVENGVVTYAELAQNLGDVVATAAAAGVPIEQVAAGFATMTKGGINAAETATSLNRVILAFLNPSEKLAKALTDAGYQSGMALLQVKGLASSVEFLEQVTGGSAEELAQLGMDARALKAALSLAREEGRVFAQDLEDMTNSTGAAQAALNEQNKSFAAQWERSKAAATVFAIEVANSLLPVLKVGAAMLTTVSNALSAMPAPIRTLIVVVAALAAGLGPAFTLLSKWPSAILAVKLASEKLGAALTWLAAHPVVAVAAGIALLVTGIVKLVDWLHKSTDDMIRNTEKSIDNAKAKQEQLTKTKALVDQYEELRTKTNRTNVESAQMAHLLAQINATMPELVQGGQLVAGAYDKLAASTSKVNAELKRLEMTKLQLEYKKLSDEINGAATREKWFAAARNSAWFDKERSFWESKRSAAELYRTEKQIALANNVKAQEQLKNGDKVKAQQEALNNAVKLQKQNVDDLKAAEDTYYEVKHRNASKLQQLEMERQAALAGAKGPAHEEAINVDFDDRRRTLAAHIAKDEADAQKKKAEEVKRVREREVAEAQAQQRRQMQIWEDETRGYESALVKRLQLAGKTYEAEMQAAINTYNQQLRELQRMAAEGQPVAGRYAEIRTGFDQSAFDIQERFYKEQERLAGEAHQKEMTALQEKEQANLSVWERISGMITDYSDRLVAALYGETAARMQQLDRMHEADRKYIEGSVADAEKRAQLLSMIDADYAMRRAQIHDEEARQHGEQMGWIDEVRQALGFSDIESSWKRMVTGGINASLAMPQVSQSFAAPSIDMGGSMGMGEIAELLRYANQQTIETNRKLQDIRLELTGG
jgi:TP901 family phage tail tape measure protein